MPPSPVLLRILACVWNGPSDLSGPLRLEWRIVLGRWLAIACVGQALASRTLATNNLDLAFAVLLVGFIFSLALLYLMLRRPAAVSSGALPSLGDGILCALMLPIL